MKIGNIATLTLFGAATMFASSAFASHNNCSAGQSLAFANYVTLYNSGGALSAAQQQTVPCFYNTQTLLNPKGTTDGTTISAQDWATEIYQSQQKAIDEPTQQENNSFKLTTKPLINDPFGVVFDGVSPYILMVSDPKVPTLKTGTFAYYIDTTSTSINAFSLKNISSAKDLAVAVSAAQKNNPKPCIPGVRCDAPAASSSALIFGLFGIAALIRRRFSV